MRDLRLTKYNNFHMTEHNTDHIEDVSSLKTTNCNKQPAAYINRLNTLNCNAQWLAEILVPLVTTFHYFNIVCKTTYCNKQLAA